MYPGDRQRLVDLCYEIWRECQTPMRLTETKSEDYKAVAKLQADVLAFGQQMAFPDDHRLRFGGPPMTSQP